MNGLFRWLLNSNDSGNLRAAKLTSLVAVGAVFAGAIFVAATRHEPAPAVKKARRPRPALRTAAPKPAPPQVVRKTAPVAASPRSEIARAMDLTTARHQIQRLKMAAATGNRSGRESAIRSLNRYGEPARGLLANEISNEGNPVVRRALEDARASLQ